MDTTGPKMAALKRYLPIAVIAAGAITGYALFGDYLSFDALEQHYEQLIAWRDSNWLLSALVFAAIYTAAVAFSLPGAIWLTLIGGFLFGIVAGSIIVVLSATLGAVAVFLAARSSFGALLHEKAGGWIARVESQFREGEVSFLLIIRLVPVIPFFICNLAPAFLGVRLFTFFWTTLIGIIPGTVVFISIGAGLGKQLDMGEPPDLGVIFEPHVIGPLLGLAVLASLPLVLRKLGVISKA
ncbi:TVP38/TMEM64 family protein [Rhodobacteraceae bacterium NNCM2]|nr:TVP38/TMEM64 family protein [Coraliihabitans acroporae]